MRREGLGILALVLMAAPTASQGRDDRVRLSFAAGFVAGSPLWTVARQPELVIGTAGFSQPRYDTLAIERRLAPGPTLSLGAEWFLTRHVGVGAQAVFVSPQLETTCRVVYEDLSVDTTRLNRAVCVSAGAARRAATFLTLDVAGLVRAPPEWLYVPYVSAGVDVMIRQFSAVGVSGIRPDGRVQDLYADPGVTGAHPAVHAALGATTALADNWLLRLEVTDRLTRLPNITAAPPTDPLNPPTEGRWRNLMSIAFGLSIVVDARHRRRY